MPGFAIPPTEAPLTTTGPEGGDVGSSGGALRQICRVFVENKLAVVGLGIIVFMVLFCFVGPLLYHTNQMNAQAALLGLPPEQRLPAGAPGHSHLWGRTRPVSTSWDG